MPRQKVPKNIIRAAAEHASISLEGTQRCLEKYLEASATALAEGNDLVLPGIGVICAKTLTFRPSRSKHLLSVTKSLQNAS